MRPRIHAAARIRPAAFGLLHSAFMQPRAFGLLHFGFAARLAGSFEYPRRWPCRPRPRALAALLLMNSTLVHEGILAGCTPPQNDPTKGRARVGVGESERTRTRAPRLLWHFTKPLLLLR